MNTLENDENLFKQTMGSKVRKPKIEKPKTEKQIKKRNQDILEASKFLLEVNNIMKLNGK